MVHPHPCALDSSKPSPEHGPASFFQRPGVRKRGKRDRLGQCSQPAGGSRKRAPEWPHPRRCEAGIFWLRRCGPRACSWRGPIKGRGTAPRKNKVPQASHSDDRCTYRCYRRGPDGVHELPPYGPGALSKGIGDPTGSQRTTDRNALVCAPFRQFRGSSIITSAATRPAYAPGWEAHRKPPAPQWRRIGLCPTSRHSPGSNVGPPARFRAASAR